MGCDGANMKLNFLDYNSKTQNISIYIHVITESNRLWVKSLSHADLFSVSPLPDPFPDYAIVVLVLGSLLLIVLLVAFLIYRYVFLQTGRKEGREGGMREGRKEIHITDIIPVLNSDYPSPQSRLSI